MLPAAASTGLLPCNLLLSLPGKDFFLPLFCSRFCRPVGCALHHPHCCCHHCCHPHSCSPISPGHRHLTGHQSQRPASAWPDLAVEAASNRCTRLAALLLLGSLLALLLLLHQRLLLLQRSGRLLMLPLELVGVCCCCCCCCRWCRCTGSSPEPLGPVLKNKTRPCPGEASCRYERPRPCWCCCSSSHRRWEHSHIAHWPPSRFFLLSLAAACSAAAGSCCWGL